MGVGWIGVEGSVNAILLREDIEGDAAQRAGDAVRDYLVGGEGHGVSVALSVVAVVGLSQSSRDSVPSVTYRPVCGILRALTSARFTNPRASAIDTAALALLRNLWCASSFNTSLRRVCRADGMSFDVERDSQGFDEVGKVMVIPVLELSGGLQRLCGFD